MIFNKENFSVLAETGRLTLDELIFMPEPISKKKSDIKIYNEQMEVRKKIGDSSILLTDNIDYLTRNFFLNSVGKKLIEPFANKELDIVEKGYLKKVLKETKHGIMMLGEYIFYYLVISPTEYYCMITPRKHSILLMSGRYDKKSGLFSMTTTSFATYLAKQHNISGMEFVHNLYDMFFFCLTYKISHHRYDEMLLEPFSSEDFKMDMYINETPSTILIIDESSY